MNTPSLFLLLFLGALTVLPAVSWAGPAAWNVVSIHATARVTAEPGPTILVHGRTP